MAPLVKVGDCVIYIDCHGNRLNAKVCAITHQEFITIDLIYITPHGKKNNIKKGVYHTSDAAKMGKTNFWYMNDEETEEIRRLVHNDYTQYRDVFDSNVDVASP